MSGKSGNGTKQPEKEIGEVYEDRNRVGLCPCERDGCASWVKPDSESPDEWAIVWIETPNGQVSWHVPRDMAENLAPPKQDSEYDGYDREVKNDRLAAWTERRCPY